MGNAIDKAVRAQGGFVVKPHQVKAMVVAARRAYKVQTEVGLVDDGVDFDTWRRATLHDVVGAAAPSSFRAVTQRDFAAVMEYFGELAGEVEVEKCRTCRTSRTSRTKTARPSTFQLRDADERSRALWSLNLVEGEVADALGGRDGARRYADALFAKIHKTSRLVATARQIWAVIFTLRNRAAKTRARTALGARGAAGVSSAAPAPSSRFPAFSRAL